MSDNVIIFGAGASADAGIPLMGGFVEKMWEFAIRGRSDDSPLSLEDKGLFENAFKIRDTLDSYHGRAMFDDRNLEDILSILSFEDINGGQSENLKWFIKAISRTIELTCKVRHNGENKIQTEGEDCYREFWKNLIKRYESQKVIPTLITFNYDLVLERSLLQILFNTIYSIRSIPFSEFSIKYYFDNLFELNYQIHTAEYWGDDMSPVHGTIIKESKVENPINIELLKLHGSQNFPCQKTDGELSLVKPIDAPFLMPPIFNKLSSGNAANKIWQIALERLRAAKNIIIVGYSLPKTDIYMQYFLKAGLGPNKDLNRIYVFDPILFKDNQESIDMMGRYACCFAPQLQSRIVFKPTHCHVDEYHRGSFQHFVSMLNSKMLF